jgi:hypothetical protein
LFYLSNSPGEAEARRDASIAEATAEEERMKAKLHNDIEIANAKRSYELNKANYDTEVNCICVFLIDYLLLRFG